MSEIGPYSRPTILAKIDGRTKEARLVRETCAALAAHCGGKPSATQRVLINRAGQLTLQIALLDAKQAAGTLTEHDGRTYLAWTNALTRLMRQLGLRSSAERPDLRSHIASRAVA